MSTFASSDDIIADQARRFLDLLTAALRHPVPAGANLTLHEGALHASFPHVYTPHAQMHLLSVLVDRLPGDDAAVASTDLLPLFTQALAALPASAELTPLFTERVSRLSQLSWELNSLRDQDEILRHALDATPPLVGAASCAVWLWDADQQAPLMRIDRDGAAAATRVPSSLLDLLRATCANACAFAIDAGESDGHWPALMRGRPVAFIPLTAPEGCLGIMSVHHQAGGGFSHDDIFLLSALGSHVATAITNIRLHVNERHLISLLQSSIRQVVQAITHRQSGEAEFVESLVDVTAGLTRADFVLAYLEVGDLPRVIEAYAGMHCGDDDAARRILGQALLAQCRQGVLPATGQLSQMMPSLSPAQWPEHVTMAEIRSGDTCIGVLVAAGLHPLPDELQAFLPTMAAQIGAGVESIEKSVDIERMLFQLSNINYVSEAITSTFDPRRIMSLISLATSQALNTPIVICGWHGEDGAIRVFPDTTHGITDDAALGLTDHNAVIRKVLDTGAAVTSRQFGNRSGKAFPTLAHTGMIDWLCVPMLVKGHARGIVMLADTAPRHFSSRDIALVSTYANQAALAMENSLLYEQIERQLRQMELLYRISRAFTATLDEPTIESELLHVAREALQVPVALVCKADPRTGVQRLAQADGVMVPDPSAMAWESERGIPGLVYKYRTPVIRGNLAADGTDALLHRLAQAQGLASVLAVPMQLPDETLGTLLVITHELRDFSTGDQQLLQAIATEAAVAFRNARIHQAAMQDSGHLREIIQVILQNSHRLLALLTGVCEQARVADTPEYAPERAVYRHAAITAIQERLSEETPDHIDVREVMNDLLEKHNVLQLDKPGAAVRATGTHFVLPVYPAALLTIFLLEYLSALLVEPQQQATSRVTMAFNQLGHDTMMVEIEDSRPASDPYPIQLNPVIIQAVRQGLQVDIADSFDGGTHRMRFRFPRPAVR